METKTVMQPDAPEPEPDADTQGAFDAVDALLLAHPRVTPRAGFAAQVASAALLEQRLRRSYARRAAAAALLVVLGGAAAFAWFARARGTAEPAATATLELPDGITPTPLLESDHELDRAWREIRFIEAAWGY